MTKKIISIVLMVGGVLLVAVSLGADLIGIGSYPGINWAQLTGAAVGVAALGFGIWLIRSK